jgi:lysozyme family protein
MPMEKSLNAVTSLAKTVSTAPRVLPLLVLHVPKARSSMPNPPQKLVKSAQLDALHAQAQTAPSALELIL